MSNGSVLCIYQSLEQFQLNYVNFSVPLKFHHRQGRNV